MMDHAAAQGRNDPNEPRLRELLDNINDLIQSVAPDGTMLFVNRGWYRTLGYAPGEIANLFQIIHPDSVGHCQALFQRVLNGENLEFVDAVFVAKDGREVHLEGSANCTFEDGKPVATNSIFRDVTARKAAERERALLRFSINRSTEGIARLDVYGIYTDINGAHAQMFGYRAKQLIGQSWKVLYAPEQIDIIEKSCFPIVQREGKWHGPVIGRKKTGEPFDVEITLTAIKSKSGGYKGLLWTCSDATERVFAQRALRQSERRFRTLFNSTYQFMGLMSIDGIVLEANEPALAIRGLAAADVIGQPIWSTAWFADSKPEQQRVRGAVNQAANGEFVRYELAIPAVGRRSVIIDFSLNPVFDEAGRVVQIVPEGRDITELHELTQKLRASEQRVRTITDNIPAMIGYMDRDRVYRFANKRAESWFGMSQQRVIGQAAEKLLGPDAYVRAQPYLERAFAGDIVTFENHRGDGRLASVTYVPEKDGDEVSGIYIFVTDITEQRQAAQNLFVEKERARTTLGSIGDGVVTIDAAERIDYLNPVAQRLTGWKLADAVGMRVETVLRLIDQVDGKPIESPLYHALITGDSAELPPRTILISKDGSEYSVEDSATPIRDSDGVITGAVLVFRDVTDKRKMVDRITFQARHDALTGLVNRAEFERVAEEQLQEARDSGHQHALLFIDLDRFKLVNDSGGHQAGDELLRRLAKLMLQKLRKSDLLGRLGGDEFGVLLENCRPEKAEQIAQSLIDAIGAFRFGWEDKVFTVGASIGVVATTRNCKSAEALFADADSACYWAKQHGRNQVKVYSEAMDGQGEHQPHDNWLERLTTALRESRFCLFGQRIAPMNRTPHDRADAIEVLLRLRDDDDKLIPPLAFLSAAERHNITPQIDRWVIEHTLGFAQQPRVAADHGRFSINLSGASLADVDFPDFVQDRLCLSGVAPQRICFEIAEVSAVAQGDGARKLFSALRTIGCAVTLDNFVSGPSAFLDLKQHPVDFLKIDGRLIHTIDRDALDFELVDSINRMAHVLNIKTIAGSVETRTTKDALDRINVDFVQGYAVHAPQSLESLLN